MKREDIRLSEHFTIGEAEVTHTGMPNVLPAEYLPNAKRLAVMFLEPIRELMGDLPIHINSFYRSEAVNRALPNSSKTSAHLEARAADIWIKGVPPRDLFDAIRKTTLDYDQLILEPSWVHIGISSEGEEPRRMDLQAVVDSVTGRVGYRRVW